MVYMPSGTEVESHARLDLQVRGSEPADWLFAVPMTLLDPSGEVRYQVTFPLPLPVLAFAPNKIDPVSSVVSGSVCRIVVGDVAIGQSTVAVAGEVAAAPVGRSGAIWY
jgi:hypothetical protein